MHKHIMYYTQSLLSARVEATSATPQIHFLTQVHLGMPWAYVGFAKGELNFLGGWASCMPRSGLRFVA